MMGLGSKGEESGSIDEEIVENLMDLRGYLEKRVQELEDEAEKLKSLFKIVDEVIVTKSFKRAEAIPIMPVATVALPTEAWEDTPLKTSTGTLLATMRVGDGGLRIVPAEGLAFDVETPPFQWYLDQILEAMHINDGTASERGEITPDNILSYEVVREGDIIVEIRVNNYGSEKRLREITSTSRWTLEKMYEKTHPPK